SESTDTPPGTPARACRRRKVPRASLIVCCALLLAMAGIFVASYLADQVDIGSVRIVTAPADADVPSDWRESYSVNIDSYEAADLEPRAAALRRAFGKYPR